MNTRQIFNLSSIQTTPIQLCLMTAQIANGGVEIEIPETIIDVEDKPGVAAEIFKELASSSVNVDMIVQNNFIERKMTNITFTVPMTDLKKSLGVLEELKKRIVYSKVLDEQNLSKVSIIGSGMRNQPGIAAKMFDCLSNNNINIVHARSRAPAWSCYLACLITRRNFVTTFNGTYNFKNSLKKFYNSVMLRSNLTIAGSNFILYQKQFQEV